MCWFESSPGHQKSPAHCAGLFIWRLVSLPVTQILRPPLVHTPNFLAHVLIFFHSAESLLLCSISSLKMLDALKNIRLYWKCQLIGWSVAALYWVVIGFMGTQFSWVLAVIHFLCDLFIYISLSHAFRNVSVRYGWHLLRIQQLVWRLIPAIIVLGGMFMLLTIGKNFLVRYIFQPEFTETLSEHFRERWFTIFVTGIRLMSIWVLAYYGYHLAMREINAVRETARLTVVAKDAAFNNLSAQLNPHFFFNALNSIKALVIENPIKARRAIDLLSDLLRTSLYQQSSPLISVEQEMQLVNDYLELEKIRFEQKLQTDVLINKDLYHAMIPPLSIQVLIENAIKHGISTSKDGGTVTIRMNRNHNTLLATVTSPGTLNGGLLRGVGLKNLKERIQLQYGAKGSFDISQEEGNIVKASLTIPIP